MLYDAHVHIGMFPEALSAIACALKSRIVPVCVSTSLSECQALLTVLSQNSVRLPVFLGVHPWYLDSHVFSEDEASELLSCGCICGVGECGLDSRCSVPMSAQLDSLNSQLSFAAAYALPVNLHIRACHGELIRELKKYRGSVTGIIHNFTFSYELAREYLDLGYKLSVGHHINGAHSQKLCETVKKIGIDSILLESDQDFEHTGNYDAGVLLKSYDTLASIFKMDAQCVELTLENNLMTILGKTDEPGIYC